MKPSDQFTVCGLFYGNHPEIADRCLETFERTLARGIPVADIRFALNQVCDHTARKVESFLVKASRLGIPGRLFSSEENRCKYPVMRRMFRQSDRPLAPWVMWFDDDTWWGPGATPDWWQEVTKAATGKLQIGQIWTTPLSLTRQRFFLLTQPWWDGSLPVRVNSRGEPITRFCQGAWWVLHRGVIEKYDWPVPELRHNGGDSMLGELLYRQGLRVGEFSKHLHINAGPSGRRSSSPRRGVTSHYLGNKPEDLYLDRSHQHFELQIKDFS